MGIALPAGGFNALAEGGAGLCGPAAGCQKLPRHLERGNIRRRGAAQVFQNLDIVPTKP